ncbi:choline transporter-like 2 isoform X2 [Periplaneta americana]|uniref:choline transporter-like 2 isoform X2 n=1 Tax=Periplaneta americana TaxID=6978 RepID=UPI0037E839A6
MARHTPTKEFGESLKYDPTFRGPLNKRSCTDVICLLLFLAFIGGWVFVGIYAFMYGDPARLVKPTDSTGRRCGLDADVKDKPYLFYFDLTKCAQNAITNGCPTPQVCVKSCPSDTFIVESPTTNVDTLKNEMICVNEDVKGEIKNSPDARKTAKEKVAMSLCAGYYLTSKEVYGRCLPGDIKSITGELEKLKEGIEGGAAAVAFLSKAKEIGHKIVEDLSDSWPFVIGGIGLAMLVCLIYIILMRWFAGIMVWLSLIGVVGLLSYCIYASYDKYSDLKKAEENATMEATTLRSSRINVLEPLKEQVDEVLAMKDTWLAFLIISAVLLLIVLVLIIFLRSRIRIAIALIKEASKAVGSITSTLCFPLFPWILQLMVMGWFVSVLLFLAGSTKAVYKAQMDSMSCTIGNINYKTGDRCDPTNFDQCRNVYENATCQFFSYEKEKYVDYFHAYNIVGVFWGLFFISGLGEMILAATFATWYWTFHKSDVPFFTLTLGIGRTFRYHLGTVAFGSLILAICRIIRVILEYINHKLKKYDNAFVKAVMCCLRCFFWCLEKFIKFINRNAYIMCAIHGKNFCCSAKDAFNLLMRNVIRVFVLDKVTDFLLFMGKLMITAGMCALSFFVFTKKIGFDEFAKVPTLNYSVVPIILIGFGTYFIASIFFSVYAMAVDTLFLCFLEDCERNDGSAEKPYFMSKELMKILRKKNK